MRLRFAAVAAASAIVLATGLSAMPAQASPGRHHSSVTVPETATVRGGYNPYRVRYKVRPTKIAIILPSDNYGSGIKWRSWTGSKAIGYGLLRELGAPSARPGSCSTHRPCRITLFRVRSGHFTRMRWFIPKSPTSLVLEQWTGTPRKDAADKIWVDCGYGRCP
jgi:hypothetical protein